MNGHEISIPRESNDPEANLRVIAVVGSKWWAAYAVPLDCEQKPEVVKAAGTRLSEVDARAIFPEFVRDYAPDVEPPAPEPQLWLVCKAIGGGWWVTEGEWKPGHPELVMGRFQEFNIAVQVAREHNATLGINGRPQIPLTVDVVRVAMERNNWKVAPTARELGVSPSTLHNWFKGRFAEIGEEYRPPEGKGRSRRSSRKGR